MLLGIFELKSERRFFTGTSCCCSIFVFGSSRMAQKPLNGKKLGKVFKKKKGMSFSDFVGTNGLFESPLSFATSTQQQPLPITTSHCQSQPSDHQDLPAAPLETPLFDKNVKGLCRQISKIGGGAAVPIFCGCPDNFKSEDMG